MSRPIQFPLIATESNFCSTYNCFVIIIYLFSIMIFLARMFIRSKKVPDLSNTVSQRKIPPIELTYLSTWLFSLCGDTAHRFKAHNTFFFIMIAHRPKPKQRRWEHWKSHTWNTHHERKRSNDCTPHVRTTSFFIIIKTTWIQMIISLTNCYRKKKIARGLAIKNFEQVGKTQILIAIVW